MKIVSFGKFSVISSDTVECGGGRDDDSFINILQNDSIIFTSSDIPELKTDQVYYAIPVKDETIVGINRFKVSLTKSGPHISFSKKGEGELKTVSGYVGWTSNVEDNKFTNIKGIRYQNLDTIRIYSSGELPYPLVEDKTYSIINATESSFQVTNETCGQSIVFKNKGQGIHFFKFSLVGIEDTNDGNLKATYTPLVTPVRNYHITDLRTRINNELIRRGKPTFTFTDPTLTVGTTSVKTYHVQELRTAAQQIAPYITLNMTDNPLIACVTKIKAIHLQEIDNYVTAREAQVKVTCTWNYTSSSVVTIPACAANDPICVWGIGGGGGGGAGGTGGTGGTGGSGGCGGRGTYSGYSYGGCGGRGGIGRKCWFSYWPSTFGGPGTAAGGGGGGGGGAGVPARQGYGGWGGGAGTAGVGGAGGGGGYAGVAGSGNIASYPAAPCVIPAGSLNLCVRVGSGGGSGSSGSNSFVCCTSGALLFNVAGGGSGSTGATGGNGGPGTNGANQTGVPGGPGEAASGRNGSWGGDAAMVGMNTGSSPNCVYGGAGGDGGSDGGLGWLAGGGGGGGGGSYNWAYKGTRYSYGGTGGGGKAGGSGGGAGGVLSSDGGVVVGGGGGPPLSGGYYGTCGATGTIVQCSSTHTKTEETIDWGPGIGTNPSGGDGGSSGIVCYTANVACYYTRGGGGGGGAPWYPGAGTPGDGGGPGGARTARAGGSVGSGGAGGPCGWFGYGCGGTGGTGGTGGYGGYGGGGGGGGAGAPSVPGGYGGSGGCGSWAYACRTGGSCAIYAYCCGTYGAACQSYASSVGAWGEGGEPGGPGDGGGPGGTGGSGYVRLNFSVWV